MAKGVGRRVPKRVGGVKVPKRLRRRAETLLDWAEHPIVNQTIAAALLAGAAALADGKSRRDIAKAAGLGAGAASIKAAHGAQRIELALAIAATQIAAGLAGWLDGGDRAKRR